MRSPNSIASPVNPNPHSLSSAMPRKRSAADSLRSTPPQKFKRGRNSQPQNPRRMSDEEVGKLVEGFGRNGLVLLVVDAISKDHGFFERVRELSDKDPAQRVVFATINRDNNISEEQVKSFFQKYGEIECFDLYLRELSAFILFRQREAARNAVKDPHPVMDGILISSVLFSQRTSLQIFGDKKVYSPPKLPPMNLNGWDEKAILELVKCFGDDYLIVLVKDAISRIPNFIKTVEKKADLDPVQRQVSVLGGEIGFNHPLTTGRDALKVVKKAGLGLYGNIEHCQLEGASALVQFVDRKSALRAMEDDLSIGGFNPITCVPLSSWARSSPQLPRRIIRSSASSSSASQAP